ncbi:hypothetical protein CAPTEDRAFT_90908 [Capitella teleta]|uniref:Thyrotropin-releasing hormone receptor n=1 Tax=Capitella teleta TaxID=283909 RepID=R7TCJ0_CAPTE|nr:hypothetical protein CAPTEDRAFT_90908 [Capitella teleta]|eukprot:ELT88781.1 hypothetical protein CAPTEDRAFT_90908 [Capitella teleta]
MYYPPAYRVIAGIFVSIIFSVGLVGNIMVILVVWRTRSLHTPTNCYLLSLALADVILLISAPLPTLVEIFLIIDQNFLGDAGCRIIVFLQYLGVNVSSLSMTFFTIERYMAICHPMKAQTICTVSRAKRIIVALWVFGICYCCPWLFLLHTNIKTFSDGTVIKKCGFKLARHKYLIYYMADLILFYVIPLLLTCVLYALIGAILYSGSRPMAHAGKTASNGSQSGGGNRSQKASTSSRVQVIKMLAIVVGLFAVLWMPYRVFVVYNSFAKTTYTDLWFILFCRIMVYVNSAVNPILYNAMSVKFRRAFKRLLRCPTNAQERANLYQTYTQVSHANNADGSAALTANLRSAKKAGQKSAV